jgi:DnaJ domain
MYSAGLRTSSGYFFGKIFNSRSRRSQRLCQLGPHDVSRYLFFRYSPMSSFCASRYSQFISSHGMHSTLHRLGGPPPLSPFIYHSSRSSNASNRQSSTYYNKSKDDLYTILGVSKTATAKEIKLAYYKEAKKCHPDLNPNDKKAKEKFQRLSKAYEILSDDSKRRQYDYAGYSPQSSSSQSQSSGSGNPTNPNFHANDFYPKTKSV